jgi:hypothetical protein
MRALGGTERDGRAVNEAAVAAIHGRRQARRLVEARVAQCASAGFDVVDAWTKGVDELAYDQALANLAKARSFSLYARPWKRCR